VKVGVLGLQGDVREHLRALDSVGVASGVVKRRDELADVDAIVIPGGESTTIGKLLDRFELLEPLRERIDDGMPAFGTCAGLILMARDVIGDEDAPHRLASLDVAVRRNAYGRQVDSFETDIDVVGLDEPLRAVFIRAPVIERTGDSVVVLARCDERPVLVRQENLFASSFHPEIAGDDRVHGLFVEHARTVG
jgi:5'-phosphate synthase pdxT subunit